MNPLASALAAALAVALGAFGAASAQDRPPEGALPLSQVLATLEAGGDVASFDEVDWDDDGHWEIDYIDAVGSKVELRADPMTGETTSR